MILHIAVYQLVNDLVRLDFYEVSRRVQNVLKDNPEHKSVMILLSFSPQVLQLIINTVWKNLPKSCFQAFQKNLLDISIAKGAPHPINALIDSAAYGKGIPLMPPQWPYFNFDNSILCPILRGIIKQKFVFNETSERMLHRPNGSRRSILDTIWRSFDDMKPGDISSDAEEICDLTFELTHRGGIYTLPLKFLAERAGSRLIQKLIDCDQQTIIRLIKNGSGIRDLIENLPVHDSIELFKSFLHKLDSASIMIDPAQEEELFPIQMGLLRNEVWNAHFDTRRISSCLSGCLCIAISRRHWKLADLLLEHRIVPWACCVGGAINAGNTELVRKLLCANPQRSEIALKAYKVSLPKDIMPDFGGWTGIVHIEMNGFLYTTPYAEAVRSMPQEVNNLFYDLKSLPFTDDATVLSCLMAATEGKDEILFRNCLNHLHVSRRQSTASSKVSYSGIHITPSYIHKALSIALRRAMYYKNATMVTELLKSGILVTGSHLMSSLVSRDEGIVRDVLEYHNTAEWIQESSLAKEIVREAARWDEPTALDILFCHPYFRGFKKQALCESIKTGNKRMVDAVFGYGMSLRELEESGLLNEIITTGDTETLREWLDRGIDPCGTQMLATAIKARNYESFQMILFAITKRYPQGNGNYGNKELGLAIELKDVTSFEIILTHLSTTSKNWLESANALKKAIQVNGQESLQMMRTLLKYGADPDAICGGVYDGLSMTPLLHAIMQRSVEKISLLLEKADINRPARIGVRRTPLQLAAELGDRTIVDLLLNRGADPNMNAAKVNGATALQLASIKGFVGVVEMLLGRNADLFAPAAIRGGRMPFEGAAEHGRLDMMTFLVGKGVLDVEGGKRQVQRAMGLAEKNGKAEAKSHAEALWKMRQQYLQTTRYEDGQANNFLEHYPMWNPQLDAVD
jgi:hypothetical protein